ncbi:MAG: TonB-dependent receptor [Bacteroidota bacterium]
MKTIIKTSIIILLHLQFAIAQFSIKGKITDNKNTPLPGTVVYIPLLNKATTTNSDGEFILNNIQNGTYILEVKLLGYQSFTKKVIINNADLNINISLETSAREIDEVVVTTAVDAIQQKENPLPIKTLHFNQLNEQASNSIIEAIGKKDNVWALTTGQGIAKPIIRGLGYNRSLVLVNGLRQEGQQWGDEHGIEIDQYSIEKAEIIKSPGSIMFGSDALAGVVNFIPYKVQEDGWHGKYLGLYQQNNQMFSNSLLLSYKKNDVSFYIQGAQKDASNYQNARDGKVFNTGFNERNVSALFQINKSWGYSQLYASMFNQKLNMPEGDRDSSGRFLKFIKVNDSTIGDAPATDEDLKSYEFFIPYQHIQHYRIQNNSVFSFKNSDKVITNIGYQYNIRDEFGPDKLLEKEGAKSEEEEEEEHGNLSMHLHTIPYQIKYLKNIDSTQMLSIGVTGMYQMNFNKGEELLIPDYNLLDGGLYAYYQKNFEKWTLAGGIRYDIRNINSETMYVDSTGKYEPDRESMPIGGSTKFSGFSKMYQNFSATVGGTYKGWKNWLFKWNIARGFRAPSISELSSNGAHEGTVRYEYGNLNLKPEVSYQGDLNMSYFGEHLLLEVSPFANYIQNYIYYRRLSSQLGGDSLITQDGESLWAFTYNQYDALIYGGEVNLDIHPHPLDFLHIESNFSYLQGSMINQSDSTKYLPFFPPSRWVNGIRTEWNNLKGFVKRFFVNAEAVYVFPQDKFFKAYHTETYTPDYTLINVSAGAGMKYYKNKMITLIAGVNNLMDVAYFDHLSRLKYVRPNPLTGKGIYNMGRNIFVRLIVEF